MKKVIFFFLVIIALGLQAHAAFDLQAWMEKVYLNHQSKTLVKNMVKWSDKGLDIHNTSVDLARENAIVSLQGSINYIINNFKNNTNCSLWYNDVASLLVKDKTFKRFLSWMKDRDSDFLYKIDNSNFVTSCIRYLNCVNAVKKTNSTLNTNEYEVCTNGIATQFEQYFVTQYGRNQLEQYSYGDEIFTNGTLEDSSFDLKYDIEQINKILYANPQRIPTHYLRWPPNYLSKATKPQIFKATEHLEETKTSMETWKHGNMEALLLPVKLYAWNISLPNVEDAIQQIESSQQQESNIVANLQCFDPAPIIKSDDAKIFKKEIEKIKKWNLSLEEDKLIDDVIGVVSQPFTDTPAQPSPWSTLPKELLEPDLNNNEPQNTDTVEDRWWTEPPTQWSSSNINNQNCPSTQQNSNLSNGSWSEITDVASDRLSVWQCLGQCQACEDGPAKRACYRKCLCTSFTNENQFGSGLAQGLLGTDIGMKLCLVPGSTPDIITPGTQVVSIQEIINQISVVMAKLRASWEYIPNSKSTEFFSPTTKIGKLSNLLNFNINVSSRSKYRIPDPQVENDNQKNYFATQTPDIAQLQISSMLRQNQSYIDFIDIHQDFWNSMKTILIDREQAAKTFYQNVK